MKTISQIIENIKTDSKALEFLPTGFSQVDEFLDGGFMKRELVVLGGYTGSGKSYLSSQIMWNMTMKGFKCAYFSLEISDTFLVSRLIGMLSEIKPTRVIKGFLSEDEHRKKLEAETKLMGYENLTSIYDDVYELEKIVELVKENKYDFVVVDFIQNLIYRGKDEYDRLSRVALILQKLAKESNSCVLVLSQLSNSAAKSGEMEYKGSGSIAMVCDLGFFLERADAQNGTNRIRLSLKKNRRGFTGQNFILTFHQPGGLIT